MLGSGAAVADRWVLLDLRIKTASPDRERTSQRSLASSSLSLTNGKGRDRDLRNPAPAPATF